MPHTNQADLAGTQAVIVERHSTTLDSIRVKWTIVFLNRALTKDHFLAITSDLNANLEVYLKKFTLLFCIIWLVVLPACTVDDEPTQEPVVTPEATNTVSAAPTSSPPSLAPTSALAYPIDPTPTIPSAYPAQPPPLPTSNAYPIDEEIWILRAAGEQCEEPLTYPDVESATSALEGVGVAVLETEEVSLGVCSACGCPTSEHYRVKIISGDFAKAQPLGWVRE